MCVCVCVFHVYLCNRRGCFLHHWLEIRKCVCVPVLLWNLQARCTLSFNCFLPTLWFTSQFVLNKSGCLHIVSVRRTLQSRKETSWCVSDMLLVVLVLCYGIWIYTHYHIIVDELVTVFLLFFASWRFLGFVRVYNVALRHWDRCVALSLLWNDLWGSPYRKFSETSHENTAWPQFGS